MKHSDLNSANDNDGGPSGVERCGGLIETMATHPLAAARFMLAVSLLTDLSLRNDQDGFHIAADAVEEMVELEPWDDVDDVTDATGEVIAFENWPSHSDGLVAAVEQAVLNIAVSDRARSLRALAMCAADEASGDWGWEIAWFLNNLCLGRLRASEDHDLGVKDFETEMFWRTGQVRQSDGNVSDGP